MATLFLIGAGAGLVSAALFASAATATALAGVLFYLAPLPICLAGLGWGWMAAAIAALDFTKVIDGDLVKVLSWYDNEYGYVATLVRHVQGVAALV